MGWDSLPLVPPDGDNWPLSLAAQLLDIPEKDLRRRVEREKVEPAGVIRMADFRRSGRHPKAYPSSELIRIAEGIRLAQAERQEKEIPRSG